MAPRPFIALLATGLLLAGNVLAAGSSGSSNFTSPKDNYSLAVKEVKAGNYRRALRLLNKVIDKSSNNADAWNYIGFSHRKLKNYGSSLQAYEKALAINPNHLGANEYLGELYLQTGKPEKAVSRLQKLHDLCGSDCAEYRDLDAAIKAHSSS